MEVLKFKIDEGGFKPERKGRAAGYDLRCPEDVLVETGVQKIDTRVHIQLPENTEAQVRNKSGNTLLGMPGASYATGERMRFLKCRVEHGTVDEDYTGEIGVTLANEGSPFYIERGTKIAQLVICPVCHPFWVEAEELNETERGENGYGSTGIK